MALTSSRAMPSTTSTITSSSSSNPLSINEDEITVEKFLELQCEAIIQDFQAKTNAMISKLRAQYDDGAASLQLLMKQAVPETVKSVCVILKCIAGSHIGQRFRLESTSAVGEEFKIGRSTGKQFKEKGVSLYKDKEISTTHAKIEIRNGQPFLVDMRSTNGTQLNK